MYDAHAYHLNTSRDRPCWQSAAVSRRLRHAPRQHRYSFRQAETLCHAWRSGDNVLGAHRAGSHRPIAKYGVRYWLTSRFVCCRPQRIRPRPCSAQKTIGRRVRSARTTGRGAACLWWRRSPCRSGCRSHDAMDAFASRWHRSASARRRCPYPGKTKTSLAATAFHLERSRGTWDRSAGRGRAHCPMRDAVDPSRL